MSSEVYVCEVEEPILCEVEETPLGYAETRMGPKRTLILAVGAFLGVLGAAALIHIARQGGG